MAVNVFEELVRAALNAKGYLAFENAAYQLHKNAKSLVGLDNPVNNPSDIDLIGLHPHKTGPDRILAINCKGGHEPLTLPRDISRITEQSGALVAGSPARTGFRELCQPDWAKAFRHCVYTVTKVSSFTHVTAVRSVTGDRAEWTTNGGFQKILTPHLELWTLDDVLAAVRSSGHRVHMSNSTLKLVNLLDRHQA